MELDATQQAVVDACVRTCTLSVIGAGGSGKSTVLRTVVAQLLAEDPHARIAVLSPDRRAATDLRNAISLEVGALGEGIVVQSITAFAFSIVSTYAQSIGRHEPELISGPDQDIILKEIFDLASSGGIPGIFPAEGEDGFLDGEMANLPAFRAEFRDLITRAAELGLSADDLDELGASTERPMWQVGARVMRAYENSLALEAADQPHRSDRVDHARLMSQASAMLRGWDEAMSGSGQGKLNMEKPQWDWVFIDDVQNATLALRGLLEALQEDGASIVTFGDPDLAVQGFRGGVAHLPTLLTRARGDGGIGARQLVLDQRYRGAGLARPVARITSAIHTAGIGRHRRAGYVSDASDSYEHVRGLAFKNENEEISWIGTYLRRLHLRGGVAYSQMAVITRSQSEHEVMRSSLVRHGVPVANVGSSTPLREQPAVAALCELIEIALADPAEIDDARLRSVLTGRLISIDPLELRAITRELRGWELKDEGNRLAAEVLRDVLAENPGSGVRQIPQLANTHRIIMRIRASATPEALAEGVLWEAWDAVGLADAWQSAAFGTGSEADLANRDLDAIIQLFRVAQRLADRDPQNASIEVLLTDLQNQDLPEDTIARTGSAVDEVTLATPSATIGRSWDHVVISGLNDGAWPNTRLRNPLTQVPALAATVIGSLVGTPDVSAEAARRDVIDDELRMLVQAVTRARETIVITCLNSEDVLPSRFIELLTNDGMELREVQHGAVTLDTDGLVGQLRQGEDSGESQLAQAASDILDGLADAGVTSADRRMWVDQLDVTGGDAVEVLSVSPSRVETMLACPMRGFLQAVNAQDSDDRGAANIGTLIHSLAQSHPDGDAQAIRADFAEQWPTLEMPDNYEGTLEREKAERKVGLLIEYLSDAPEDVDVEVFASGELDGIKVNARIDRLERDSRHPENVGVVDFKTGKGIAAKDVAENPQLLIYQWLVDRGTVDVPDGRPPVAKSLGAKLVVLGADNGKLKTQVQEEAGDSALQGAEDLLRSAAKSQAGPDFAATINDMCKYCEYKTVCPAQNGKRVFS